jgi:hypothetical protein
MVECSDDRVDVVILVRRREEQQAARRRVNTVGEDPFTKLRDRRDVSSIHVRVAAGRWPRCPQQLHDRTNLIHVQRHIVLLSERAEPCSEIVS